MLDDEEMRKASDSARTGSEEAGNKIFYVFYGTSCDYCVGLSMDFCWWRYCERGYGGALR